MPTFSFAPDTPRLHTSCIGHIVLIPTRLTQRFGPPKRCDDYKVSGQYTFEDDQHRPYTLYDYKETTLYHGEETDFPTPAQLWSSSKPVTFHIGGCENAHLTAFQTWLDEQLYRQ